MPAEILNLRGYAAIGRMDKARQDFLKAWQDAAPHMSAKERSIDVTSTINAMLLLAEMPKQEIHADRDGGQWR